MTLTTQLQNEIEKLRNLLKEVRGSAAAQCAAMMTDRFQDRDTHFDNENEHLIQFHPRYREALQSARSVADELEVKIVDGFLKEKKKKKRTLLLIIPDTCR
jgi:hypothetical protein